MKLPIKAAGLCGTGTFILATYPAMFRNADPLNILSFGLPAAIMVGMLGYIIGDILAKPKGHLQPRGYRPFMSSENNRTEEPSAVTGEETFLDDNTELPKGALPIEPSKMEED